METTNIDNTPANAAEGDNRSEARFARWFPAIGLTRYGIMIAHPLIKTKEAAMQKPEDERSQQPDGPIKWETHPRREVDQQTKQPKLAETCLRGTYADADGCTYEIRIRVTCTKP